MLTGTYLVVFVTFEGPEGSGKSTAIEGVAKALRDRGHEVVTTREPGEGEIGRAIREILLHGSELTPTTELFLFLADRAHHVERFIRPSLEMGRIVLCDRFADSTVVYQGVARGLDADTARELNAMATGGLQPDLTLLLDVEPVVGLSRISEKDRLDLEPLDFHEKVRAAFLAEAARNPARWVVIDAAQQAESVSKQCLQAIEERIAARIS